MAYQQKENSGTLFRHQKTKDTQPDYTGTCLVAGKAMRMSAWVRTPQNGGNPFLSISFEDFQQQRQQAPQRAQAYQPAPQAPAPAAPQNQAPAPEGGDDLPF